MLASAAAWPQEAATPPGDETVEEIVVTGSRLVRRDFDAPSPIFSLDDDALKNSGQPTLEAALNQMPQVLPDFGRASNNPGDGTSRINLRGLGSNRTLVMLNGRRIAPSGVGNAVDVNTIPQALIQRVEVITGGASAVYGSDAVAGVVNFITHDDYDGLGIEGSAYVTEAGDSEVYDLNMAWGRNFGAGGNIALFAGWLDRGESFAGDRPISARVLQDTWENEVVEWGSFNSPVGVIQSPQVDLGSGVPVFVSFNPDGTPKPYVVPDDLYNYAPLNYLQVPLTRYYGGLFGTVPLRGTAEAYVEASFARNEGRQTLAPAQIMQRIQVNIDNPVLAPETRDLFANNVPQSAPGVVSFPYQRRLEELGSRVRETQNDYTRIVAGLRGDFGAGWEYDAWVTWTSSDETTDLFNSGSRSRLQQGLLVDPATGTCFDTSNSCVPVNPFGAGNLDEQQVAFIRLAPFANTTRRDQRLASAFVRGAPFETWAGPATVALGAEWRSDEGRFAADEALFEGDAMGYNPESSVDGEESVSELYGEALLPLADGAPLARYVGLEFGGRISEYDNAGSTDTWKLGGEWEPVADLRFRVMKQRSVRAPDLQEAFQEQLVFTGTFVNNTELQDPCSADQDPIGNGNVEKCVIQGLPADQVGIFQATPFYPTDYVSGGNPALTPETATTLTWGAVWSGFESWLFAVDFFELAVDHTIGVAAPSDVCFDAKNTGHVLCDRIRRDPLDYNVVSVDETTSNLGQLHTRGFDLQVNYGTDLPGWLSLGGSYASLELDFVWTSVSTNSIQSDPAVDPIECAGWFGFRCAELLVTQTVPENRTLLTAQYAAGPFDAVLGWRWIEGTKNDALRYAPLFGYDPAGVTLKDVGSKSYVDLGLGYRPTDSLSLRLNVANLFDTDPPLMADAVFANNTDERMYDIFGRSYQLSFALAY